MIYIYFYLLFKSIFRQIKSLALSRLNFYKIRAIDIKVEIDMQKTFY
jgi:hypothetical protein